MDMREFYERHLPHWHPPGATLFLTMRLAGSLPASVAHRLHLDLLDAQKKLSPGDEARLLVSRQHFGRFDALLDACASGSPQWLREPLVARLVQDSLHWLAQRGDFALLAACVMPNHLHVVLKLPLVAVRSVEQTLRDYKTYTAVHGNRLLGRTGAFWQSETYDRVVRESRDGQHLLRAVHYVINNPVKARLCAHWTDWPGTWCAPEVGP